MRVAVSGTHSVGKSMLVADIHETFGKFIHEEEPYRALREIVESLVKPVRESLRFLDVIVFVPVSREHPIHLENDVSDRSTRTIAGTSIASSSGSTGKGSTICSVKGPSSSRLPARAKHGSSRFARTWVTLHTRVLASCHRISISSSVASLGFLPRVASCCST